MVETYKGLALQGVPPLFSDLSNKKSPRGDYVRKITLVLDVLRLCDIRC